MQAKECLKKIRRLDELVRAKEEDLAEIRSRAESIGGFDSSGGRVQTSPTADKLENSVIAIMVSEQRLAKEMQALYTLKTEATERIDSVENTDYRLLLTLRYLRFKSFEEIAESMGYSLRHTHRLHGEALSSLDYVIECHY